MLPASIINALLQPAEQAKEQGWHHHQKHHSTELPTPMKDEPTPPKSSPQTKQV
jgi:hypothetical protein